MSEDNRKQHEAQLAILLVVAEDLSARMTPHEMRRVLAEHIARLHAALDEG